VDSALVSTAHAFSISADGMVKPAQWNWTGTPKGSGRCTTSRKIVVSR
jgi:hypothetical protein